MLTIKESKPQVKVNVEEILKAGQAKQPLLKYLENPAGTFTGDAIKFEFLQEEVTIAPVLDLDDFFHDIYVKGSKSNVVALKVVDALIKLMGDNGLDAGYSASLSPEPAASNALLEDPASDFVDAILPLMPVKAKASKIVDITNPGMSLFDIVPGTSSTDYRAIYRDERFLMACRLKGDNKSGVVRMDFLNGYGPTDKEKEDLKTFGFSLKTGANSEGTYVDYASCHLTIANDDVVTMTDYIWMVASRLQLRIDTKVSESNLKFMSKPSDLF